MDPDSLPQHAQSVRENPEILREGYAVQGSTTIHGVLDDYWWICPACVDDFRDRFKWIVLEVPY